jgi:hypothetical protein
MIRSLALSGWVFAAVLVAACGSASPTSAPGQGLPSPSAPVTSGASAGQLSPGVASAIVGSWRATYRCEQIYSMLHGAGLDAFLGDAIYGNGLIPGATSPPSGALGSVTSACAGAVEVPHEHFFTTDGRFGSRDANGRQVDDGTYSIDASALKVNGQSFGYHLGGDRLVLTPPEVDISGCTTQECRFTAAWVLMVALPGSEWIRQ